MFGDEGTDPDEKIFISVVSGNTIKGVVSDEMMKTFLVSEDCQLTDYHIGVFKLDGINAFLYVNGVLEDTMIDSNYNATTIWKEGPDPTIGTFPNSTYYLSGDIAEFIIYKDALSDSDRQGVEIYLNTKYGL